MFSVKEVVSGAARGIDRSGEIWAAWQDVKVSRFPADWQSFGRSAGPKRNRQMAAYADALIAFWDGKSKGTLNMINEMRKLGKPYHVVPLGGVTLVDLNKERA